MVIYNWHYVWQLDGKESLILILKLYCYAGMWAPLLNILNLKVPHEDMQKVILRKRLFNAAVVTGFTR